MRYFIYFSYDGTNYHGWQKQPNSNTVQQVLDDALSILLRQNMDTVGAGRTDAGVHAHCMVAHFDVEFPLDCKQLTFKLNRLLPNDVAIQQILPVKADAHARFDAISRTYHYRIYTQKHPFYRQYATRINVPLDFNLMNLAAQLLLKTEDFTSFSKLHTDVKTNICHVTTAKWKQIDTDLWEFEITANRFLRNMVRAVVGTLIAVGRNKITLADFQRIIDLKNRCAAGDSMPGNALSLVQVTYNDDIFL